MTFWQLKTADIEAIVSQLQAGRTKEEVARDLGISVEMVTCAVRQADRIRNPLIWGLF